MFEVPPLAVRIRGANKGVVWVQRIVHLRVTVASVNQFLLKEKKNLKFKHIYLLAILAGHLPEL